MPQVFKREWTAKDGTPQTSKIYYARFQVNGKDFVRSTGNAKKGDAVQEMQRMISEAREMQRGEGGGTSGGRCSDNQSQPLSAEESE